MIGTAEKKMKTMVGIAELKTVTVAGTTPASFIQSCHSSVVAIGVRYSSPGEALHTLELARASVHSVIVASSS